MLNKRNVFTRLLEENLTGNLRTEEERQGNRFEDKINLWKSKKKKERKGRMEERRDAHATYGSLAVNLTGVYLNLRSRLWPAACTGIMYGRMNMHRTRYELRPPPPPRETRTRDDPLLCSALLTLRFHEPPPLHVPFI